MLKAWITIIHFCLNTVCTIAPVDNGVTAHKLVEGKPGIYCMYLNTADAMCYAIRPEGK